MTQFERTLLTQLTERTGRRVTLKNALMWSIKKTDLDRFKDQGEEEIFLPGLEVWCLVRS